MKRNVYEDPIAILLGELVLILFPFFLYGYLAISSRPFVDALLLPEWSFVSSILFSQSIIKLAIKNSRRRGIIHDRIVLGIILLIVCGITPALVFVTQIINKPPQTIIDGKVICQIVWFILSIGVFLIVGISLEKEIWLFHLLVKSRETKEEKVKKASDQFISSVIEESLKIAVLGKTGVGKSTTIKKIFNPEAKVEIGHLEPTTKEPVPVPIDLPGRGMIEIIDFPGLGATLKDDKRIIEMYKRHLPKCDVVIWVLEANSRALAADQGYIQSILSKKLKRRLVIGINKIDSIQPGEWNKEKSLPSPEQDDSIIKRTAQITCLLGEIGIKPEAIVPYSAIYSYNPFDLMGAIVRACPEKAYLFNRKFDINGLRDEVERRHKS